MSDFDEIYDQARKTADNIADAVQENAPIVIDGLKQLAKTAFVVGRAAAKAAVKAGKEAYEEIQNENVGSAMLIDVQPVGYEEVESFADDAADAADAAREEVGAAANEAIEEPGEATAE